MGDIRYEYDKIGLYIKGKHWDTDAWSIYFNHFLWNIINLDKMVEGIQRGMTIDNIQEGLE